MVYLHTRMPPIIHRDLKSPNLVRWLNGAGKVPVAVGCVAAAQPSCVAVSSSHCAGPSPFHPTPQLVDDNYHCKVTGVCQHQLLPNLTMRLTILPRTCPATSVPTR